MTTTDDPQVGAVTRRGAADWAGVALIGLAFVSAMIGTTLPTPLYPSYAARFGYGEFVTTLVFAAYAVGVLTGLLLFGHWSDQLGRRLLLLAALVLSAAAAACFLLVGPLALLFTGRFLSGLSAGVVTGTATATIIDLAPPDSRARAGFVAAAVNMGGLGLGPLLAGSLVQYARHPLRLCYVVDLVLVALGALAVLLVRDPVTRADRPALAPRRLHVPDEIRGVFVRAAVAGFAGFAVLGLFTAVSPAFLGTVLHRHSGLLVGITVLVLFGASVLGQSVAGRIEAERALTVGCGGLAVGMVIIGAGLLAHSLALLLAGAVVAGAGQGLSFRAGTGAVTSGSSDADRGTVTSTLFVVLYIGISLPVIGVGALSVAAGLVTAGVIFAALVGALAVLALVLVRRGLSRESAG